MRHGLDPIILVGIALFVFTIVMLVFAIRALRTENVARRNKLIVRASMQEDGGEKKQRLGWLQERLDASGSELDASDVLMIVGGLAFAAGVVLGLILGPAAGVLGFGSVLIGYWFILIRRMRSKTGEFEEQLGYCLPMIAENIRSGQTFENAIKTIGEFTDSPLKDHLAMLAVERSMGVPIDEAMMNLAARSNSRDAQMLAAVVSVQAETGGAMADILDSIAETIQRRVRMRKKVAALTADGRISAIIIAGIPFVMLAVLLFISPNYILPMFASPLGVALFALAIAMIAVGLFIIRKLYRIKIY